VGAKPIVYLHPSEPTDVSVTVSHPELFVARYPAYGDGWQVRALPDGMLTDRTAGRELYALCHEFRRVVPAQRTGEGFVVVEWGGTEILG